MKKTNKLTIGAYYLAPYASTPEHVRDLAQCGIDVVMNMRNDRAALDLLAQNGVGAIVSGIVPGWFGGDGSNAGTMAQKNPLEAYEFAAQRFEDHPAIVGIDAGDEPSSLDFPHYGRAIDAIHRLFPNKFAYLNIYPRYALKGGNTPEEIAAQLGTDSYRKYIERYVRYVNTPYICFDYYLYSADLPGMYESLAAVSEACRKYDKDMWMVLQVNSHQPDVWISEKQLQFQANCALAFGARSIIWACYCAGWWYNHVLDKQGNKTQQYDKLRRVNAGLHEIGETYMQYRHVETCFVGEFGLEEISRTGMSKRNCLNRGSFSELHAHGEKLVAGVMKRREGDQIALFIMLADDSLDPQSKAHEVVFKSTAKQIWLVDTSGKKKLTGSLEGEYSFTLCSCQCAMLIAE